jgi:hypothetical protein
MSLWRMQLQAITWLVTDDCCDAACREHLSQQPSTADEFVAHATLIAEVEAQRPAMDAEFDAVSPGLALH